MSQSLSLLNGLALSVFGSILSAAFCGVLTTPRNRRTFLGWIVAFPLFRGWASTLWPMEVLQVTNPCQEDARVEKGIPVSDRPGHGVGVQSICAIVQRYRGAHAFLVQDGRFILRLFV